MIEFTITGEELWARMERALEKVNERLRKTVRILEDAKVPYAVIGDHAVRAWVAQVDEAALGVKGRGVKGTQHVFGWVVAKRFWISYFD